MCKINCSGGCPVCAPEYHIKDNIHLLKNFNKCIRSYKDKYGVLEVIKNEIKEIIETYIEDLEEMKEDI